MGFWEPLFFWIFAAGALVTSCAVIVLRNPLYCALALIVDFFFFAGLYVLLSAHFIAIAQVLVYGGAIMVLFIFIIMLLNLSDEELGRTKFSLHHVVAALAGILFFFFAGVALMPLAEKDAIEQGRAVVSQQTDEEVLLIQTPSTVPGLFADLNEAALEVFYRQNLQHIELGMRTPATDKYRPFDPEQKFVLPPSLSLEDEAFRRTQRGEVANVYGTVEPFSVLLVNRFVVPFQLTALLLLAAVVGAVIIAKRRVES